MPLRIPQMAEQSKFSHRLSLSVLQEISARLLIADLLSELHLWEQRERKLSQLVMVSLLLSWHLFAQESLRSVFLHLSSGVRFFRVLLRRVCKPLATPQTPGAFAYGYRLTAIDGTLEDVADSQENARFFGRISEGKTASPYPQARCLSLVESRHPSDF